MPNAPHQEPPPAGAPWFAALYDVFMQPVEHRLFRHLRAELLANLAGNVLEVGAGTGANLPMMKPMLRRGDMRLTAVEPNPAMARRAIQKLAGEALSVEFISASAERLPFDDETFDQAVGTLVLCSVADLEGSLKEIRRVLKPGGEFWFLEHVRAPGLKGRLQDALRPGWACLGDGCQLNRSSIEAIRAAGFEALRYEQTPAPFPIYRVVWGSALAPSPDQQSP